MIKQFWRCCNRDTGKLYEGKNSVLVGAPILAIVFSKFCEFIADHPDHPDKPDPPDHPDHLDHLDHLDHPDQSNHRSTTTPTYQKNYQDKRRIRIVLNNTSFFICLVFLFCIERCYTSLLCWWDTVSVYRESRNNRKIFWLGGYVLKDLMIELPQTQRI